LSHQELVVADELLYPVSEKVDGHPNQAFSTVAQLVIRGVMDQIALKCSGREHLSREEGEE